MSDMDQYGAGSERLFVFGGEGLDPAHEIRTMMRAGAAEDGPALIFANLARAMRLAADAKGGPAGEEGRASLSDAFDCLDFLRERLENPQTSLFAGALCRFYRRLHRMIADAVRDEDPAILNAAARSVDRLISPPLSRDFLAAFLRCTAFDREAAVALLIIVNAGRMHLSARPRTSMVG